MSGNQEKEFLKIQMKTLVVSSASAICLALLFLLTKNNFILISTVFLSAIALSTYLYIATRVMYRYFWYFNGGKIDETRDLDLGFITGSSISAVFMVIFAFISLLSLISLAQTGNTLLEILPEEYASLIFGIIPSLVLGICIFCILFIILFLYVEKAEKMKIHVLRMEIQCNRLIIIAILLHYSVSVIFYINRVVPYLKNSDISITTNNLLILSLAALWIKIIIKLISTNLENGQRLETESH